LSCGFEADGANEGIEIINNALIEAIKLGSPLGLKSDVCFDGAEKACGEWCVDAFEELKEDEANRVPLWEQLKHPGRIDAQFGLRMMRVVSSIPLSLRTARFCALLQLDHGAN
jgi:hypothetical protein